MIKSFLNYIEYAKGYSQATITNYSKALRKFNDYLIRIDKDISDPESIKLIDVYNFIEDMSASWLAPRTCAGHIYWVTAYLRWCKELLELDVIDTKKIHTPKIPDKKIWFFSDDEKKAILRFVKKWFWYREETQLKYKLLVYMLLHTWLRCHEIAKIKLIDIAGENLQVIGKWWSRRFVYLRKEILELLYLYLWKRKKESDYLFPWNKWNHICRDRIVQIMAKMSKEIWIHVHAHKFRHTFATDLLHVPWSNIYSVAKLLGHKRITTTQIYLGTSNAELKKIQFWLKYC